MVGWMNEWSERLIRSLLGLIDKRKENSKYENHIHFGELVKKCIAKEHTYSSIKKISPSFSISASYWNKLLGTNYSNNNNRSPQQAHPNQLDPDIISKIQEFWRSSDISRVSSSKVTVIKRRSRHQEERETVPTRYRMYSIKNSYKLFLEKHPDTPCSRSSFFKYKPREIKKARSKTDMCPICKVGQQLGDKIAKCPQSNRKERKVLQQQLEEFRFHSDLAKQMEKDYVNEVNEAKEGKCVICIDFKSNISLGKGYNNDSHIFFNAPQRSLIGAVCFFFLNGKNIRLSFLLFPMFLIMILVSWKIS